MLELNRLYNMDCMKGMAEFPGGFFDLAIVDPPYGIGVDGQRERICTNTKHNRKEHIRKSWDKAIPRPNTSANWNGYRNNKSFGAEITSCRILNRGIKAG